MLSLVPKCSYKFFFDKNDYLDPRYTIVNGGNLGCNPFCRSLLEGLFLPYLNGSLIQNL